MKRWLMAAVIGLTVAGCAAGVEDPEPGPTPDPVRKEKEPPAQTTFSEEVGQVGELQGATSKLGMGKGTPELPPLPQEKPPKPGQ